VHGLCELKLGLHQLMLGLRKGGHALRDLVHRLRDLVHRLCNLKSRLYYLAWGLRDRLQGQAQPARQVRQLTIGQRQLLLGLGKASRALDLHKTGGEVLGLRQVGQSRCLRRQSLSQLMLGLCQLLLGLCQRTLKVLRGGRVRDLRQMWRSVFRCALKKDVRGRE
jgi:hypothetical protein